jgi:uncharacterized protein DUF4145
MDPTLVAEIVKAVAWPVASIVLVFLVRRPLTEIFQGVRINRVEYDNGKWRAYFGLVKENLPENLPEKLPEKLLPENIAPEVARPMLPYNANNAAATNAILTSWAGLEDLIEEVSKDTGSLGTSFKARVAALSRNGIIKPETVNALNGLRHMRDLAAHAPGGETTLARAREFITLAEALDWTVKDEAARAKKKAGEK